MIKKGIQYYFSSFQGLSLEIWLLAGITFVNRAGTMVLPFLSLYLTASLEFTLSNVGWIMTCFGLGSTLGSWLGGKLTDRFGFYPVMIGSLIGGGSMFLVLQVVESFWLFCFVVFWLTTISDIFRPAIFVAVKKYSKEKDTTRAVTLIRLAINLGFSFAPALGGFVIAAISYKSLFIIDGLTCIGAGLLCTVLLKAIPKDQNEIEEAEKAKLDGQKYGVFHDKAFLLFLFIMFLFGFVFIQLFANVPLFYRDIHGLNEQSIGWLMALNGLMIFVLEMPLIHSLERSGIHILKIISFSTILIALSFFLLNAGLWYGILVISMILITVGEMLAFPFTNTFALSRAPSHLIGVYMGWYSMSFSFAHIFGPNIGLQIVDKWGFGVCWTVMGGLTVLATLLSIYLYQMVRGEKIVKEL